jgi:hypothetical protein
MDNFFQLTSKYIKNKKDFISICLNKNLLYRKLAIIEPKKGNNKFDIKDIKEDNINKISINKKIIKKRNAAVDLLRIIAMIGIVFAHILNQGKGFYKYNRYKNKLKNLYTYVFWHNNVYALLSGIVGYKSTKYSNLLYIYGYA